MPLTVPRSFQSWWLTAESATCKLQQRATGLRPGHQIVPTGDHDGPRISVFKEDGLTVNREAATQEPHAYLSNKTLILNNKL